MAKLTNSKFMSMKPRWFPNYISSSFARFDMAFVQQLPFLNATLRILAVRSLFYPNVYSVILEDLFLYYFLYLFDLTHNEIITIIFNY